MMKKPFFLLCLAFSAQKFMGMEQEQDAQKKSNQKLIIIITYNSDHSVDHQFDYSEQEMDILKEALTINDMLSDQEISDNVLHLYISADDFTAILPYLKLIHTYKTTGDREIIHRMYEYLTLFSFDKLARLLKVADYLNIPFFIDGCAKIMTSESTLSTFMHDPSIIEKNITPRIAHLLAKKIMERNPVKYELISAFGKQSKAALLCIDDKDRVSSCVAIKNLIIAGSPQSISTFDSKGVHLSTYPYRINNFNNTFAVSPDNKYFYIGTQKKYACLEVSTHKVIYAKKNDSNVYSIAINNEGTILAVGLFSGEVLIVDSKNGNEMRKLTNHKRCVNTLAFNKQDTLLATGSWDTTACIWDYQTGKLLHELNAHEKAVNTVAFHPNKPLLVTGSHDSTIYIWDTVTGQNKAQLKGHSKPVNSIAFNDSGSLLASGSNDEEALLWNGDNFKLLYRITDFNNRISSLTFIPETNKLVTASGYSICIWDNDSLHAVQKYLETKLSLEQVLLLIAAYQTDENNPIIIDSALYPYFETLNPLIKWAALKKLAIQKESWTNKLNMMFRRAKDKTEEE